MNYWLETVFVIEHYADIRREVASYNLLRQAQPERNWFEQRMLYLGLWLVAVGERLCQRYETTGTRTALTSI